MRKVLRQFPSFKWIIPCIFLLLTVAGNAFGQKEKGQVAGKIIEKSSGEPLIGATVQIEGTSDGTATDLDGSYVLDMEPGAHALLFSYTSFQSERVLIHIKPGETVYANLAMEESVSELMEVVITSTLEKSSATALLIERKNTAVVSDGISADLIRKTPDRTTSDVLKRVTGASVQEGKFAIIRGMNDRYNAGYLDGALLPSTEADRKAFAFDAVPANLIDNLVIIKAGTPDLAGDFGGGVIKIMTKAVPEKFHQHISVGVQGHSLTTGKEFTEFKKYPGEAFNMLSDKRDLPAFSDGALKPASTFPTGEEKTAFAEITRQFNNDWSNKTVEAAPNSRFLYSLGFPVQLSGKQKLGVELAVNYANTRRFSEGNINTYDGAGQVAAFNDRAYLQNISGGGIFNLSYAAAKTQMSFRNLLNLNTDNNTILRSGMGNISELTAVQNIANVLQYNRLSNSVFSFKQMFGEQFLTLHASLNYSSINRKTPDYRIVNYTKTSEDDDFRLALGDFFNTSTGRFVSDLNEDIFAGNLQIDKPLRIGNTSTEIKAGAFFQSRDRSFFGRSFTYGGIPGIPTFNPDIDLSEQNIAATKLYLVEKTNLGLGYYDGKSDLTAFFALADQKFFNKLRAVYGIRYEHVDMNVFNPKTNAKISAINEAAWLPSVNLTWSLTDKINLRGAWFSSVNRPEFREMAPFSFFVFDKNAEIRGNQNLQIAKLQNFDLRMELYPSGNQVISVGGFYKHILNPVEFSIDISQPFTTFTYENEKSARIYGVELEARKNLDFMGEAAVFKNLVLFSNLALVKSALQFEEGSQARQNRPLQGQSPFVLNVGIQYENTENGWFGSLALNRVGRRIAYVGVDPKYGDTRQDIYEAPRSVFDFQVGKNLGNFNLKLTLGDLWSQNLRFYQDANNDGKFSENGLDDRLMFQYTYGRTASLTLGYAF